MLTSDIENALEAAPYNYPITTVRLNGATYTAVATNPGDQAAVDADLPTVISDLQAAEADASAANNTAVATIATFTGGSAGITYFSALHNGIKTVVQNNTSLATFFPTMLTTLQSDALRYGYYLTFLEQLTTITPAQLTSPSITAAQQRQAYQVAVAYSNTGMIENMFASLYKG